MIKMLLLNKKKVFLGTSGHSNTLKYHRNCDKYSKAFVEVIIVIGG
jgi:hypothetical protein